MHIPSRDKSSFNDFLSYLKVPLGLGRANHSFCGFNFGGGGGGRTGRSNEFRGECELFLFTTTGSERFSDFVLYLDSDWLLPELVDREIFQCDFSLLSTSDWSAESSPEMSRSFFWHSKNTWN